MKYLKIIQILLLSIGLVLLFSACGESSTAENHDSHGEEHVDGHDHDQMAHGKGKAYTSTYVCVMHCEGSGSEEPGDCPVCGMTYVKLEEHVADGHMH
jgi:hypothetical protein